MVELSDKELGIIGYQKNCYISRHDNALRYTPSRLGFNYPHSPTINTYLMSMLSDAYIY